MSATKHADITIAARLIGIVLLSVSIPSLIAAIGMTFYVIGYRAASPSPEFWWWTPQAASGAVAPTLMLFVATFLLRRSRRIASIFCPGGLP